MKKISIILTMMLLAVTSFAQDWQKDLEKDLFQINWIEQAHDGSLIVAGDKAMAGVNAENGEVIWINKELAAVEKVGFELVDELPFFVAQTNNLIYGSTLKIVNAKTGEPLLNEKDEKYKVMGYSLVPEKGAIIFQLKEDKQYKIAYYDIVKQEKKWVLDVENAQKGLKGLIKGKSNFLTYHKSIDKQTMVASTKNKVFAFDVNSGQQLWEKTYDKNVKQLVVNSPNVFIGYKDQLDIVNSKTGKSATKKAMKLPGKFNNAIKDGSNYYITTDKGFNILDGKTNQFLWKKGYSNTAANDVIKTNKGFVIVTKAKEEGDISLADNNGKKIWSKKVKGDIYTVAPMTDGVLYITSEGSNVFGYSKGKELHKKSLKIKGIPSVGIDEGRNELLIFSKKTLSAINLKTGDSKEIATDIVLEKFKAKEDVISLEGRKDGYLISTNQNAAFVTTDGKIKYNNYYKHVKSTDALTVLGNVGLAALGVDANIQESLKTLDDVKRLSTGTLRGARTSGGREAKTVAFGAYVNENPILEINSSRYYASKADADFLYIFYNVEGKGNQISKINKDTGEVVAEMPITDKNPVYLIDSFGDAVIIAEGQKVLKSY